MTRPFTLCACKPSDALRRGRRENLPDRLDKPLPLSPPPAKRATSLGRDPVKPSPRPASPRRLPLPRPDDLPSRLQAVERGIERPLPQLQQPRSPRLQSPKDLQAVGLPTLLEGRQHQRLQVP